MPVSIVHLSDLHLGNDIWWRALAARRSWRVKVPRTITDGLIRVLQGLKPDYVVVSGDFVSNPTHDNFGNAALYLRTLFANTGISVTSRVLVVPGNHDVSLYGKNEDHRLIGYHQFLEDLFGGPGRKSRFLKIDSELRVIFLCLDSTLKNKRPLAEGEIGHSQILWARENLTEIKQSIGEDSFGSRVKIAVMHHHCKQIRGMNTSDERFMNLLDAEEIKDLLHEFGFNLVLHGHKHMPRVDDLIGAKGQVLTVVGAGTAVCPILEEQHQMGNNFNFIKIDPEANEISVQMFKADGLGDFSVHFSRVVPLQPSANTGYTAREMSKTVTINADRSARTICSKEGIRVLDKTLRSIPLSVSTTANGAKIIDIASRNDEAELRINNRTDTMLDAELVLREPLTKGREATVAWSHLILGDAALTKDDLRTMSDEKTDYDSAGLFVLHPAEWLNLEVNFPHGMNVSPVLYVEQFGNPLKINDLSIPRKTFDKVLNRFSCRIRKPEAGMRIEVRWVPPDTFPS
jgi:3',5'-cyclic AMP phosphodiesterase CpdA